MLTFKSQKEVWNHLLKGGVVFSMGFVYRFDEKNVLVRAFKTKNKAWQATIESFHHFEQYNSDDDDKNSPDSRDVIMPRSGIILAPPIPIEDAVSKKYIEDNYKEQLAAEKLITKSAPSSVRQVSNTIIFQFEGLVDGLMGSKLVKSARVSNTVDGLKISSLKPVTMVIPRDGVVRADNGNRLSPLEIIVNGQNKRYSSAEVAKGDLVQFHSYSAMGDITVSFRPRAIEDDTEDDF